MAKRGSARKRGNDATAYLRADRPLRAVPAFRPSPAARRAALRLAGLLVAAVSLWWFAHAYVLQSAAFRLEPRREALRISGVSAISEDEVAAVFAGDLGASLASVDLSARQAQLRALPWVRSARVARVWPHTLAGVIEEREAVAFLRLASSSSVFMIDADGAILDPRGGSGGSLPVLSGIAADMPLAERRRRVRVFQEVMRVFNDRSQAVGRSVSEVDLADATNPIVLAKRRSQMIRLQMGDSHLPHRLDVYLAHVGAWEAEFGPLEAVDLRFEKQVAIRPLAGEKGKG